MKTKLYLLRPIEGLSDSPWEPWYDKTFGFVVRAVSEEEARELANNKCGDEGTVWKDSSLCTCVVLAKNGLSEIIIEDGHWA